MALERFQERWEQITPRERALVLILGSVLLLGLIGGFSVHIQKRLTTLSEKNDRTR